MLHVMYVQLDCTLTLAKQSCMHLCRVFFSGLKPYTNVHVVRVQPHTHKMPPFDPTLISTIKFGNALNTKLMH